MFVKKDCIERLKHFVDIVDIIGSYIEIKRAGSNYSACCPFHNEKTPSFMISPKKGYYHCYGCGVGGDSITFVMEYEKLSFGEALEKVASMCNFTLEYEKGYEKKEDSKILESISAYYQKSLHNNTVANEYLTNRGISASSIEKFNIGYAGQSYESVKFVDDNNFNRKEAIEYGEIGRAHV